MSVVEGSSSSCQIILNLHCLQALMFSSNKYIFEITETNKCVEHDVLLLTGRLRTGSEPAIFVGGCLGGGGAPHTPLPKMFRSLDENYCIYSN